MKATPELVSGLRQDPSEIYLLQWVSSFAKICSKRHSPMHFWRLLGPLRLLATPSASHCIFSTIPHGQEGLDYMWVRLDSYAAINIWLCDSEA